MIALNGARGRCWAAIAAMAMICAASQAWSQSLGLGGAGGGENSPLEVFADQGIEWRQNDSAYVARGNARAVKGDTTVYGDTLTANYRKGASGSTEVWRVEARGNVRITTPNETAYGDLAIYTIDNSVLVMTGKDVRLDTQRERITARDSLEYWEQKNMAVARGEAVVETDEGRRIRADVLTAEFKPSGETAKTAATQPASQATAKPTGKPPAAPPSGNQASGKTAKGPARAGDRDQSQLRRLDAYGNVIITTPEEVARGNRGTYFEETGIATLTGSVKITRGKNQLNGEAAEVNLRTGVSRIVKQGSGGPVRALIVPERKPEAGGTPEADPAAPNGAPSRAPGN